ncbi:18025_t:CDS:2 [Funneliformis geosporum]|nr:18025_t:CDS:2 [Funneliformis geosporum]
MGGEIPALAITDSLIRAVPGAIQLESYQQETFTNSQLDFATYTRPEIFEDLKVPAVLLSGNHKKIEEWRTKNSFAKSEIYQVGKEKNLFCQECCRTVKNCSWCQKEVKEKEGFCRTNDKENTPEKLAERQQEKELLDKGYKRCDWNLIPFESLRIGCNNLIPPSEKYCETENDKKVKRAQNWDNFSGYMSAEVSESSIEFKNGSLHVYPEDLSKIPPPLLEKFGVETSPSRYKKDFPGGSLSDKEKINQLEKLLEIAKKNDNKAEINNLEQELQALKSQTKGNSSSEKLPNSESNKGNKRNVFPSNLKEGKLKILVNKLVDRYAPPQIKNSPEIRQFINSSMNLIDTIADEKIGKETINILAKIFKQAAQNEQVIEGSGLAVLQKTGTETEVKNLINDFAQHLNKLTEAGGKNNLSNEREASIIERLTQNNSNPQPSQDDTGLEDI